MRAQFGIGEVAQMTAALQQILAELKVQTALHKTRNQELAVIRQSNEAILQAIGPMELAGSGGVGAGADEGLSFVQEVVPNLDSMIGGDDVQLPEVGNYGQFTLKAEELFGSVVSYKRLIESVVDGKAKLRIKLPGLDVLNSRRRSVATDAVNRELSFAMSAFGEAGKAESTRKLLQGRQPAAVTVQRKLALNGAILVEALQRINQLNTAIAHLNYGNATAGLLRVPHIGGASDFKAGTLSGGTHQNGLEGLNK